MSTNMLNKDYQKGDLAEYPPVKSSIKSSYCSITAPAVWSLMSPPWR